VSVDRAFAEVEAELGPCDVLVNNAGIKGTQNAERLAPWFEKQNAEALGGRVVTPLDALVRLEDDEWHGMLAVHLNGTFYCSRAAARQMVPNGGGTIVNVASICGLEGCAGHAHHSAAKAGILGFTRAVAKELVLQDVRVNAIAPGSIAMPRSGAIDNAVGRVMANTPAGRFGRRRSPRRRSYSPATRPPTSSATH